MNASFLEGRGPYMHSAGGRKLYPFDPRIEEIDIDTIAHHLACINRWNGATQHPTNKRLITLSVAEHSIMVADYMVEVLKKPEYELEALLHDAAEFLISDIIRPIKHHPDIHPIIKPMEDRAELIIAQKYGLLFPLPPEVKIADEAVCAAEARQVVPRCDSEDWSVKYHSEVNVAPYKVHMLDPYTAKHAFIRKFNTAVHRRKCMFEQNQELLSKAADDFCK